MGEQFGTHFLVFRYLIAFVIVAGLWAALRFQSARFVLATLGLLGVLCWLFTWLPLERPYGLRPGSQSSFEMAVASTGSATDTPLDGWIVGRRNARPAWSLMWYALAPGRPDRARRLYELVAPLTLSVLPLGVFLLWRRADGYGPWEALSGSFSAVFASSVVLDAFRPFGVFHREFFVTPHRPLGLLLLLAVFGLVWRGGAWRKTAAGFLLGIVGWMDVFLLVWGGLSFLLMDAMNGFRSGSRIRRGAWPATLLGCALASPQIFFLLRSQLLYRGLSRDDFLGFQKAYRDLFAATTDMEWIFVLALVGVPVLWRRRRAIDSGLLSILAAGYILWICTALTFHRGPLFEPDAVFHFLRFGTALVGGVGAYHLALRLIELLRPSATAGGSLSRVRKWLRRQPEGPLALVIVVVFLLPRSALFLWHPLRMDPLYYPSLQPIDTHVERLEDWVLANTDHNETILTSGSTGEWVAALTGRRVLTADRVLSREERRERLREQRALFLSGDPTRMREATMALGASVLVLDPFLREVYWQLDPALLESSGLYRKIHQIGERYTIYRAR
jgi:hypothetical protein